MKPSKFDKHQGGKYNANYFEKNPEFYRLIKEHMQESLKGRKTKGLDIGAGPGIGARIAAEIQLETMLDGHEPSDTHFDGEKLAEELRKDASNVIYVPKRGGIEDIEGIINESLDYVLILRACHEIAGSVGGKEVFWQHLKNVQKWIKKGGILIAGDPQFSQEITANPEGHAKLIREIQRYQEDLIGHSHVPADYFTYDEMERGCSEIELTPIKRDILEHADILRHLGEKGFSLESSPNLFYVETFVKNES